LGGVVPARRDDEDVWLRRDHFIERDAEGWSTWLAEDVASASKRNHFWHPVASDVNGLQPFEECYGRAFVRIFDLRIDSPEFFADFRQEFSAACG
jgi:hypothetical protein